VDIISTGNPHRKGVVLFRCINESCDGSKRWANIIDKVIKKLVGGNKSGRKKVS
jgi:hypothetical protein